MSALVAACVAKTNRGRRIQARTILDPTHQQYLADNNQTQIAYRTTEIQTRNVDTHLPSKFPPVSSCLRLFFADSKGRSHYSDGYLTQRFGHTTEYPRKSKFHVFFCFFLFLADSDSLHLLRQRLRPFSHLCPHQRRVSWR